MLSLLVFFGAKSLENRVPVINLKFTRRSRSVNPPDAQFGYKLNQEGIAWKPI
jgi:hypothetical protein